MCVVCTRSQMAVDTSNGQMSLHILIRVFLVWPVSSVNLLCQNSAVEWLIWNFSNWLEIVFVRIRWRWFEKFQVGIANGTAWLCFLCRWHAQQYEAPCSRFLREIVYLVDSIYPSMS